MLEVSPEQARADRCALAAALAHMYLVTNRSVSAFIQAEVQLCRRCEGPAAAYPARGPDSGCGPSQRSFRRLQRGRCPSASHPAGG